MADDNELIAVLREYSEDILDSKESKLQEFFEFLIESEGQALALIAYTNNPNGPPPKVPEQGSIEFGFILYWIHNPPEIVHEWIDEHLTLKILLGILQEEAPPTKIETPVYQKLLGETETTAVPWDDGTLIGTQQYEQLDRGWLLSAFNYAVNVIDPYSIAPFPNNVVYQGTLSQKKEGQSADPTIGIIGDWGTGYYVEKNGNPCPAQRVLEAVTKHKIDYLMHLGDVYYAGTDWRPLPGEEKNNFLSLWPNQGAGRNFTLNSNHELYGDDHGYFDVSLAPGGPFGHQHQMSYFSLVYGPWLLLGLDSAYFSDQENGRKFYILGAIGTDEKQQQIQWLNEFRGHSGPIMVMTHHNASDLTGENTNELFNQVTDALGRMPSVWYWGHVHNGIVYDKLHMGMSIPNIPTKGRCCGHAAIPFGNGWALEGNSNIEYYAHTPDDEFPPTSPRVRNGYALVTLHDSGGFTETFYEVGTSKCVYTRTWPASDIHVEG